MNTFVLIVLIILGIGIGVSLFMTTTLFIRKIYIYFKYKDDRGWQKCMECGEVPPTIYYDNTFWGVVYKCDKCTDWNSI